MDHESIGELVPIIAILVPILITLGAFIMVTFLRKYENDERMALIAKGIDPSINKARRAPVDLRYALLAIGASIGLLMGNLLEVNTRIDEVVAYFSMLLLFGGLGLIAAYLLQQKREEKEKKNY